MMSLKALTNTGYSGRAEAALGRCIDNQDNSVDLRLAALATARSLPCDQRVSKNKVSYLPGCKRVGYTNR